MNAMATAAAMKAKLKFIEEESKLKSAMDKLQAMRELRMAKAQLEAFNEFEEDSLDDSKDSHSQ